MSHRRRLRTSVCPRPGCPRLTPCPVHGTPENAPRSKNRDRSAQRRMRVALMQRAGGRCEEIDSATGQRCTETTDLRACHLIPLVDGGSYHPSNGKLRCKRHDKETDRYAR